MGKGPNMRRGSDRGQDAGTAPWLDESDYEDEGPIHTLIGTRIFVIIILVVVLLTIGVAVGISLVSKRGDAPIDIPAPGVEAPLLTAPGAWKVQPTGPGADGVPVEGQGQILYGTSEGRSTDARIALDALPEEPLPKPGAAPEEDSDVTEVLREPAPAATAKPAEPVKAPDKPATAPKIILPANSPDAATPAQIAAPTGLIQLGAFSTNARARSAFQALSSRFAYLQGLEPLIIPTTQNGKTLYRLRARVADKAAAKDICGRLAVAGEACSVVNQN